MVSRRVPNSASQRCLSPSTRVLFHDACRLQIHGAVDPNENRVSVKTIDLAAFMRQRHKNLIEQISFIKIDTEGYDRHILRTLPPLLDSIGKRPPMLIEWFRVFSNQVKGAEGNCTAGSVDLFAAIEQIRYTPHALGTGVRVNGCTNDAWIPDLLLLPMEK